MRSVSLFYVTKFLIAVVNRATPSEGRLLAGPETESEFRRQGHRSPVAHG